MSILKIARMGHPVLRARAEEVKDLADPEISQLVDNMIETMVDAHGRGLAANQVHVLKRIIIYIPPSDNENTEEDEELKEVRILINPVLEKLTDETEEGWEGCLSVPEMRGVVPRFKRIHLQALTRSGVAIDEELSGYHARVVQHECDHLNGILYPMRMKKLDTLMFDSEWPHWMASEQDNEQPR